jgi:hypothetical protein
MGVLGEHINKAFTYPQDVASVCKSFKIASLMQPADFSDDDYKKNMGKKMLWETYMKTYMNRVDLLESNTRAIYAIIRGQCSPIMQSKLESLENYEARSDKCDCIWLIHQGIAHRLEGMRNVFISLVSVWNDFLRFPARTTPDPAQLSQGLSDQGLSIRTLWGRFGPFLLQMDPHQDLVMAQVREDSSYVLTKEEYVE